MRDVPWSRALQNHRGAEATEPGRAWDPPLGQWRALEREPGAVSFLIPVLRKAGTVEASRPEAALECVTGPLSPPPFPTPLSQVPAALDTPGVYIRLKSHTSTHLLRGLGHGSTKDEDKLRRFSVFHASAYPHIASGSDSSLHPLRTTPPASDPACLCFSSSRHCRSSFETRYPEESRDSTPELEGTGGPPRASGQWSTHPDGSHHVERARSPRKKAEA